MQTQQFNKHLKECITTNSLSSRVVEAASYSLLLPGKRLRPLLLLEAGIALGLEEETLLKTACALEMIHTYSLIHDDLPCMDDDSMRRGMPCVHKQFDEATALLAGDLLFTKATELIASDTKLSFKNRCTILQELTHASGEMGMIGGQMLDMEAEADSLRKLEQMHRGKTGALFGFAFAAVAQIANKDVKQYRQLGTDLGYMFQILDDLKDRFATDKTAGSDTRNGKITILTFLQGDEASEYARTLADSIIQRLESLIPHAKTPLDMIEQLMTSV